MCQGAPGTIHSESQATHTATDLKADGVDDATDAAKRPMDGREENKRANPGLPKEVNPRDYL